MKVELHGSPKEIAALILDYRGRSIDLERLEEVVRKRLQWRPDRPSLDIMIILSDDDVRIWRYQDSK